MWAEYGLFPDYCFHAVVARTQSVCIIIKIKCYIALVLYFSASVKAPVDCFCIESESSSKLGVIGESLMCEKCIMVHVIIQSSPRFEGDFSGTAHTLYKVETLYNSPQCGSMAKGRTTNCALYQCMH